MSLTGGIFIFICVQHISIGVIDLEHFTWRATGFHSFVFGQCPLIEISKRKHGAEREWREREREHRENRESRQNKSITTRATGQLHK